MEQLLKILEDNARLPIEDIATMLNKSPAEVAAMIDLARAQGIIKGYKTLVDWEKAGVNRVEAVIELNVSPKKSRGFDEIAAGSGAPVYIRVFHYWFNNAAVLEALVRTGRADILAESLKKLLLRSKELPGMDEARLDYFAANTGYVMTGILATWLRRGRRESEEELADILADCFAAAGAMVMLG